MNPNRCHAAVTLQSTLCAIYLTVAAPVAAQSTEQSRDAPLGFSGTVGPAVLGLSTYEGGRRHRAVVAPDLTLIWRSASAGAVEFGPKGLVWRVVEHDGWTLALAGSIDLGRKDHDTSATDPTPGDDRLRGMGTLGSATEAGVMVGWGPVYATWRRALSGRGHAGTQAELVFDGTMDVSERLGVRVYANALWTDAACMQAYFGVTPAQSAATGFAVYTPGGGLRRVDVGVGAEYRFLPKWKMSGGVGWVQLTGEARKSPLVERAGSAIAATTLSYEF